MIKYEGLLSGSAVFVGIGPLTGITENLTETDDETLNLTINANGTFSGTIDDNITTTVAISGSTPTTTTTDSGPQSISGTITNGSVTYTSTGNPASNVAWQFSSDSFKSQIAYSSTTTYSGTNIGGTIVLTGTLAATAQSIANAAYAKSLNLGNNPQTQPVQFLNDAWASIKNARDVPGQDTLALRDAEYYIIGEQAGALQLDGIAWAALATGYEYLKWQALNVQKVTGYGGLANALRTNPNNPISPPGGPCHCFKASLPDSAVSGFRMLNLRRRILQ